ncbi:MAG: hypothetical protein F6J86_20655 [Symploca sp. SIO1B1]|nr:hypothetical protein [Symploca sp. SIO1C2]NER96221.1 hypothetical protein [Symploca sp. SIO1B1]
MSLSRELGKLRKWNTILETPWVFPYKRVFLALKRYIWGLILMHDPVTCHQWAIGNSSSGNKAEATFITWW